MNRFLAIGTMSLVFLLAACSTTSEQAVSEPAGAMDDQSKYTALITKAEAAFKEASQMGAAWAYTEDMIKDAKTRASQNQFDEAIKLAKEAYDEAVLAKAQFESQKDAGPYLF